MRQQLLRTAAALLFVAQATAAIAAPPVAVSPGSASHLRAIAEACPTFSWSAVDGADYYELVVYGLDPEGQPTEAVLEERLPGAATSWTPGLERCLGRGERYAWMVRAVRGQHSSQTALGEWSEARLFQVPARPSDPGLESTVAALVQRYLSDRSEGALGRSGSEPAAGKGSAAEPNSVAGGLTAAGDPAPAGSALGGADFSIDGSGNVMGLSFAGEGSALTGVNAATLSGETTADLHGWSNLTGVPPGFADGTDDSIAYAAGNQLSLNATTFDVVEGSGSGLDADLLDGLEGAAFALGADTYSMTEVDALLTVGNIDAPIPSAPTNLRLTPNPSFLGMRRLWWNMDSLAGVATFVVYRANFPITDGNKTTAHRKVAPSLYAQVEIFPGSGTQYFRVEAQNVLGQAGPLSTELAIDTTSRLAYRADQRTNGLFELFTTPTTGGGSTRVSENPVHSGEVTDFAWSPDGSRLAYRADQDTDEIFELYVVPATGGPVIKVNNRLVAGRNVVEFAWSPDGSRLAYRADQDTDELFDLYVVPASGGGATEVASDVKPDWAWSPDGARLAYRRTLVAQTDLFVAPADGGGSTRVNFSTPLRHVADFAWSPEGSRLAYRRTGFGISTDLFVVPDDGGVIVIAKRVNDPLPDSSRHVDSFAWSPDGSRLAYLADQDTDDVLELYVAAATGGGATKVNDTFPDDSRDVDSFGWSPGGSRLAYLADQDTLGNEELYVVPATGGGATKVNDPLAGEVSDFAWSPDESRLAYRGSQSTIGVFELYVVPATGGGATRVNDPLVTGGSVVGYGWSPDGTRLAYFADQDTLAVRELYVVPAVGGGTTKVNDPLVTGGEVAGFEWSPLGVE